MDLSHTPLLFLDCQTSGLSARSAEVLEIGWILPGEEARTELTAPREIEKIPKKVWNILGLSPGDFAKRDSAVRVWQRIVDSGRSAGVRALVIHYSSFEMGFFRQLHGEAFPDEEFPWPVICTYKIAGQICADLPARTLRALSGYLGRVLPPAQRSLDHVEATEKVWQFLRQRLSEQHGISTWEAFLEWSEKPREKPPTVEGKKARAKPSYLITPEVRKSLPTGPGIYEMRSAEGILLYIGKATNLRTRVASYFQHRRGDRQKLPELMTQVRDLQVIETATPLEAALLETDRIKKFEPHYNTQLRKNDRRVLYFGWDLQTTSDHCSESTPLGPFIFEEAFESVGLLHRVLRGTTNALDNYILMHPPELVRPALEQVLGELGICDLESVNRYRLWKLGKSLGPPPEEIEAEESEDEGDEDADEDSERELSPEELLAEIKASILRKLRRPAYHLHRSHWMAWMLECRAIWKMGKAADAPWRYLVFSKGEVVESGTVAHPSQLPPFTRPRLPVRERRQVFNVTDFDRVRVLMTELEIIAKNFPVYIDFSPTRRLTNADEPTWVSRVLTRAASHDLSARGNA
jgi:DNA polymerase-3 subunit epsilon